MLLIMFSILILGLGAIIGGIVMIPLVYIVTMTSGSLAMTFGVAYALNLSLSFVIDIYNILSASCKKLFDIKNPRVEEHTEYVKGPITAGFRAGLAAADIFGAGYGTGYEKFDAPKKLLGAAYRSFTESKIRFNFDGEVVHNDQGDERSFTKHRT